MKALVKVIAILSLLLAAGCAETQKEVQQKEVQQKEAVPEQQLYTAHNIWKIHNLMLRRCINYKYGNDIIPAGTKVRDARVAQDRSGSQVISFVTVHDNHQYKIYFKKKWHPGHTIEDYKNYMFTPKTFDELTRDMTDFEIDAIKHGVVRDGMSKAAVLVSYGRPPEHRTLTLDSNVWIYWRNKLQSFPVCFDKNDITTFCK